MFVHAHVDMSGQQKRSYLKRGKIDVTPMAIHRRYASLAAPPAHRLLLPAHVVVHAGRAGPRVQDAQDAGRRVRHFPFSVYLFVRLFRSGRVARCHAPRPASSPRPRPRAARDQAGVMPFYLRSRPPTPPHPRHARASPGQPGRKGFTARVHGGHGQATAATAATAAATARTARDRYALSGASALDQTK